ncbi:MAG: hypothetical protein EOP45_07880 [Sphingobacteriaceae bacterium]|nr:MAG: hypothetical protein EOP45_07880 [Sphingobacteriaceae bacterium]
MPFSAFQLTKCPFPEFHRHFAFFDITSASSFSIHILIRGQNCDFDRPTAIDCDDCDLIRWGRPQSQFGMSTIAPLPGARGERGM